MTVEKIILLLCLAVYQELPVQCVESTIGKGGGSSILILLTVGLFPRETFIQRLAVSTSLTTESVAYFTETNLPVSM